MVELIVIPLSYFQQKHVFVIKVVLISAKQTTQLKCESIR